MTVEAVDEDGRSTILTAEFEATTDDPCFIWQVEQTLTAAGWTPPAIGETMRIERNLDG